MFCTRCGQSNPEDSAFCSACGHAMSVVPQPGTNSWPQAARQVSVPPQEPITSPVQAPIAPQNQYGNYCGDPQQPYAPQGAYVPPKKKSGVGLIVGLSVGGALLIAAVVVLLFVWPGFLAQSVPVNGFWYSEDRGEALEFKNAGSIRVYTTNNKLSGDYTYDNAQGIGNITVDDEDYQFAVTEDGLYVESMGCYKQAEAEFDVDDFIDDVSDAFNEAN